MTHNQSRLTESAAVLLAWLLSFSTYGVVIVSPGEMAQKGQWVQKNLLTATNLPPFSFLYG